jgi:phosphoribosylformimino-5-aminoimidazole carboxamide ribotide isomerase
MDIWPAIDLRNGKCVRLQQGDYSRETVFGDDPTAVARRWISEGAQQLHLVDLDGARDGHWANRDAVEAVVREVGVPCQLGGGIRDRDTIAELFGIGVNRVVIGTRALKDPDWFRAICREYPDRIVLGLDARNGCVATDGWLETSEISAVELARQFEGEPIAAIVYTDIAKDGMLAGPNLPAMQEMAQASGFPLIASGGVTTREDVRELAGLKLSGCIIGRTLYEGQLTLSAALEAAQGTS